VRAFSGNDSVSFGDVDLSGDAPMGRYTSEAGRGGWPTIRYFNKETGINGGAYVKKTDKAMCDELGNEDMMISYIEDYSDAFLCMISTGAGCEDREVKYAEKMRGKSSEDLIAQVDRLEGMVGSKMKPDLLVWIKKRKKILLQLLKNLNSEF